MMRKLLAGIVALLSLLSLSACADSGQSITVVGSSALQPLVEAAGGQYQTDNLGVFINVQGGGSGTGLSQIQQQAVAIGNSDVFAEEKTGIDASKLVDHRVAVVGVTPIVHPGVGVKNVSLRQLRHIFTGELTNWKQLGGKNVPITIVNRAQGSGTRATFERWVLKGKQPKAAQEQDSTGMVRSIVSSTPGAISYVAFSYVNDTVATLSVDHVTPTDKNVATNAWPIWSYEHMYTNGQPTGLAKDFLAYVLAPKTQTNLVQKMGYIPVTAMTIERGVDGKVTPIKEGQDGSN